ncbi:MAG: MoxR family ATPase [Hyphomicrobium zavarzinii]|jgi:MoxR-like ATPase|uniref:AAA family ATPase n=1 Tax=Hyphomicrobium TaxID=81 RepID=UPI0003761B6F|nr:MULTISPECIES: MoxR family ATPase [Hyphomicrobium]MBL8845486.1 MoxR family ATPase [Hyphomicrobium zavarzinii]WBT37193.1 MoxR family ATPase [Hyphomicrobium sp. DMF-1]HML44673.1 MoxR family ATPase [Hyphomicrobium zavarzinii]
MPHDKIESGQSTGRIDLPGWRSRAAKFETEIAKAVVGQERVIRLLTIALFARGHVLLEGDVGVGKTTLLRAAARAVGGAYERIEGTIDLMPGDLIYHTYLAEDGRPRVDEGPVLRAGEDLAIFFFNEINRARPQVHSLLLRLMAERSVTAFNREFRFPHLVVFADRNRVEREETFELPAAARDRFLMEIAITTPADLATRRELAFSTRFHDGDRLIGSIEEGILPYDQLNDVGRAIQEEIKTSDAFERYVLNLWQAVRYPAEAGIQIPGVDTARLVAAGASPRGLSYLVRAARVAAWLDGRTMAVPEDVRSVFFETMAHRIFFEPVYELRRERVARELIDALFETVPVP